MAAKAPITKFEADADLLAVIAECTNAYGCGEDAPGEWPNNLLSKKTVVYGSGRIAREGNEVSHAVDPDELALCRRLSSEIASTMVGTEVGMGSEASDEFKGFFIAGNVGNSVPAAITEAMVRDRFGGTIFPPAKITVEPLAEQGLWWEAVGVDSDDPAEAEQYLAPWRKMIDWFKGRSEFKETAFVMVGDFDTLVNMSESEFPIGTVMPGSVFPRMPLGLTRQGSLVGLFGNCVQT